MSLIGNSEKCVKLLVDNLLWGNVSINWGKIDLLENDVDEIRDALSKYAIHYDIIDDKHEYTEMIGRLYKFFLSGRFANTVIGELRDREEEVKIRELESHNQRLAEHLSQAYVPPKDSKVGTN